MSTDQAIMQQQVSCRITNSVLKYGETIGIDLDKLVAGLPFPCTKEYLSNPVNWVTAEIIEQICQRAAEITGDKAIMVKVGMAIAQTRPLGGLGNALRKLAGPLMLYRLLPVYTRLFNAMFKIKTVITGKTTAFVEITGDVFGRASTKHACYFIQGVLAAIPEFWNLPAAQVRKIRCVHDTETPDEENAEPRNTCTFEVQWQPPSSRLRRFNDITLGKAVPSAGIFDRLDQNLKYSTRKNTELVEKNKQLAVIRQIAIEIDKVRTIDEAMTLTVEQAGDIDGIRMIFVQRMDEARKNVVTPYYSKLRPDTQKMVNAIKILGIDLEKAMGDPDSNILRFPIDSTKVAQEYNRNPRVMIIPTLAELLDGTWPKTICDGIQKIAGIKKCVIVPIKVGGESWGHMLFILNKEIPVDILEMITSHCSQAIKNIIYLENVEQKNVELTALNRIAMITSKSLNMNTLLNDTLAEIKQIFTAHAAAIYLTKGPGQPLKLMLHQGLEEEMVKQLKLVNLENLPLGKFFNSTESIMSGTLDDFTTNFPLFQNDELKKEPVQNMTSVLRFRGIRYGLINVTRRNATRFTDFDRSLLLSISAQLALALENTRLHDEEIRRADEAEAARNNLEELFQRHSVTENKLRESEERYRNIFESANDILILFDNQGKILDVNVRMEDIGGYKRSELVGKGLGALAKVMTKESLDTLAANYKRTLAGTNVPYYDVEMITPQGKHLIIQVSAVALHKDGNIIGDLAILRDITELKQAEKNLLTQNNLIDRVLATIPNAVLLLDNDKNIVMANQSFYNLFRVERSFVEGRQLGDVPDFSCFRSAIEKAMAGKKEKTSTEIRYTNGTSDRMLVIDIFSMQDDNLLVVMNDVTEERKQQERLYLTDRLASVGEMASGVAHELNNPLTSIIGLSGLLKLHKLPLDVKEDLDAINSEAQRCAAIVKNLLTFARKHASKKEAVQVENVVKDVVKLRDFEHRANNISIETVFAPDLPYVMADYYQMQQVFLNIIINAEAAMADANKQGKLKITTELADGQVRVSFKDDGPGITKETLGLIFNPFFTTKAVGKGTGLGLSIVYGIVTSHGGKVYANSEYGHGATFVVELPAIKTPSYVML
jgi:PAS domain S-box-containing protein